MANTATHVEHTLRYRAIADFLHGISPASAGEIMWLAVVQATQATGHRYRITAHTQSRRGIRNVVGRLPVNNNERARLIDIADLTVINLHGLAYQPSDIDELNHRAHIRLARDLVDNLLRHA